MTNGHLIVTTNEAAGCTNLGRAGELWNGAGCSQKRVTLIGLERQGCDPCQETMGEAACRMASFLTVFPYLFLPRRSYCELLHLNRSSVWRRHLDISSRAYQARPSLLSPP